MRSWLIPQFLQSKEIVKKQLIGERGIPRHAPSRIRVYLFACLLVGVVILVCTVNLLAHWQRLEQQVESQEQIFLPT